MFIVVLYGYKQQRIFTIDCLTASLLDCIWLNCIKDIQKLLALKEDAHTKESANLTKKIKALETQIEQLAQQLEEQLKKEGGEQTTKKDDKKGKAGKKGKEQITSDNPIEQQKIDCEKNLETYQQYIIKYQEKLEKIKLAREKYDNISLSDKVIMELLDRAGERKFAKTKLFDQANSFLSDKNTYILSQVFLDEEEKIEVCELDGFAIRACEEDEGVVDEPLVQIKKDDKKGAKKAGKK